MYAIIQTGGKQYKISPGDEIKVEKIDAEPGSMITIDKVLAVSTDEGLEIGRPYLENRKVKAKLIRHGKGKKIIVFKFKRRKNYKRKKGHRQLYSVIKIEEIE
ncbi:MAG: 50S ribosomal protein L21 [Deltaproteobacteria bacterium]|nr:MAG: 50S ribosomal protein L21 [Deltaproteobacteria bacterium]